ncbi:hypothetical protein [Arthrobacter sp. H5]|uniref:hypothetical protein n=1 Tax=Arthrobacter sp. H5 TaxID=1267973 RepID=UPI000481991C|nr:hypothetical protein [Arthrobacter sp. H5]
MRTRATALPGSGLLLTGALFLTGCDDTQLPETPGLEEQDGEDPDQGDNPDDQDEEQDEEQDQEQDGG